jgi:hypothetical protein
MMNFTSFGLAAVSILCVAATPSLAGTLRAPQHTAHPATQPAQDNAQSDDSGRWTDWLAGKRFSAVDGSTAMLSPSEAGFVLDTVTPDGTAHDVSFTLLSDNVGSIYEGDDHSHVTGVFRVSDNAIEANFADGRNETIAVNAAGGISLFLNAPGAAAYCMKWYPEGHAFGEADRKAALAAYADRLGLAQSKAPGATRASCIEPLSAFAHPRPAATSSESAPPLSSRQAMLNTGATTIEHGMMGNGLAQPISVRTSEVHPIDPPIPAMPVTAMQAPIMQPAIVQPQPVMAAQPAMTASLQPAGQNHGASSCLKIDTDGASWGFHNACGYNVQYAYCLMKGSDRATACGSGTGSGSLEGNGFVALMPGNAVVDADNQFRWVACTGGSDVSAQLDRSDPPAGRCLIASEQ